MSNYMVSYIEKKLQKPWLNQKTDRALCYGTDVRLCKQQIKDIISQNVQSINQFSFTHDRNDIAAFKFKNNNAIHY